MREIILAEIRRQEILAEVTRYRLASQVQPVQSAVSVRTSLTLRVVRACGRTLVAGLVIITHVFAPKGNGQEQTMITAAR